MSDAQTTATHRAEGRRLLKKHLEELRASGLNDDQIRACDFYSETNPGEVARRLGWDNPAKNLVPCLAIPYCNANGEFNGYIRYKPDHPRLSKKEGGEPKPVKYESPRGKPNRAYFPPGTVAALLDPSRPVVITEGEKKAAKADQDGFPTIGLVGVWAWMKKRKRDDQGRPVGEPELIDDLAAVRWEGRTVYVCYDSDAVRNDGVRKAEEAAATLLAKLGAKARIIRLPEGPAGPDGKPAKVGLDDFLVAHAPDDFRALMSEAKEAQCQQLPTKEELDDPFRLARAWIDTHAIHDDHKTVAFYREQFWRWQGRYWKAVPDAEMRALLTKFSKRQLDADIARVNAAIREETEPGKEPDYLKVPKVTTGLIANVLQALSAESLLHGDVAQPFWLDVANRHANYVSLENGILDVEALMAGRDDALLPHTPLWFSPVHFPYRFDPKADCPLWKAFLARNLDRPEKAALLQRFFGYLLLPDPSLQRFLLMVGDGANGKSVICAAMRAVLGEDNVSSVPLELFGDKFRLHGTLGKLANVVAEVGELDKIAEGQVKAFVVGDKMEFERKFKTPFSALPTARLVLATNNPPQFSDKTDGIWRRMLLLKFLVQIPEEERVPGMDSPAFWRDRGELPGILNWSLAGLFELRRERQFLLDKVTQDDIDDMRGDANPARRFLAEFYEKGDGYVECEAAYESYKNWCAKEGHHPQANVGFGREVHRTFRGVKRKKVSVGEARPWCYCGLQPRPRD